MTTVIDHAIAIPTRPATVWEIVRDISNLPTWHPDSKRVQHLTTMKSGRGTRWRNTTKSNKEQVLEITAWYEGLGYEYRIVDGSSYINNRGRIRLQEAPEGTVVQWTFSYDVNGFLRNLRNNLTMKGQADKEIVQGLRNLYTLIKESKSDEILDPEQSKAYLREAPNVEERASYQPRYPSKVSSQEIPAVQVDEHLRYKPSTQSERPVQAAPKIQEPPITEEDTRPNPSVQQSDEAPVQQPLPEPDFLKTMPDPAPMQPLPPLEDNVDEDTVAAPELASVGETETVADIPPKADKKPALTPNNQPAKVESMTRGRDASKVDTATISVFELFGLEKPSETEKVSTLPEKPTAEVAAPASPEIEPPKSFMDSTPIIPDVQPEIPERRRGLRAALRSNFTKVRVPRSD